MALVVVYNGSIAAGGVQTPAAMALTAPFRGVEVQQQQTMAAGVPRGVEVYYAISIDAGVTYSDWIPVYGECNPLVVGDPSFKSLLINSVADHIKFKLVNRDPVTACTSFLLQAIQFA